MYPRVDPSTGLFRLDDLARYAIAHYVKATCCAIAVLYALVKPLFALVLAQRGSSLSLRGLNAFFSGTFVGDRLPSMLVFDDRFAFTLLFGVGHGIVFCGCALVYSLLSRFDSLNKYKIPRRKSQLPSSSLLGRALKDGVVDSFLVVPCIAYAMYPLLFSYCATPEMDAVLEQSLLATFFQLLGCNLTNEFLFAVLHRLFHHPKLYRFHKQHHEFKGTVTLASEYSSIPESIVTNIFPNLIFGALAGIHPAVFTTWLYWTTLESAESHCGFMWAGTLAHRAGLTHTEAAAFHDCHHTANRGNYGTGSMWMDQVLLSRGAMDSWIESGSIVSSLSPELQIELFERASVRE